MKLVGPAHVTRLIPFRDKVEIDCVLLFRNVMAFQNFFGVQSVEYLLLACRNCASV